MTIEECYQKLGGDIAEVADRLPGVSFIRKFVARFLDDDTFDHLCREISAGNRGEAFRAAHTLKGICQNLGFGTLLVSAVELTEALRPETAEIPAGSIALFKAVERDYADTTATIRAYLAAQSDAED